MIPRGSARRRTLLITLAVAALAAGAVAAFVTAVAAEPGQQAFPLVVGGGLALFAAALALTALVLSQGLAAGRRAAGAPVWEEPAPAQRRVRFALVGPALLLGVLGSLGVRWYGYVTNTRSPFDEVGIDLNARAPAALRAWGCGRLKATFGGSTLPPYGCASPDEPGRWR